MKRFLKLTLLSDASFGRGDGLAGVLDWETEHNQNTGLPLIKGRAVKGLLVEECSNLLFSLEHILKDIRKEAVYREYVNSAEKMFGYAGCAQQ